MKAVVYSPAALQRLEDMIAYTWDRFGEQQAQTYAARLMKRVDALASGETPRLRSCDAIMLGVRSVKGLCYYREASHYLILRESPETLEVVEIFHEKMDIERHLRALENNSVSGDDGN